MQPLVSVIVPVYNRGPVIAAAVRSALEQSVEELEVIVVDDGSDDNGSEIVAAIGDPRVRFIAQPNGGANAARNRGIDAARGRFVAMLDSDDRLLPGHLERALDVLRRDPRMFVFARVVVDRGDDRHFLKPPRGPRAGERIADYLVCGQGFVQTSTVVLSTENARAIRYLDGLRAGQDIDFAVRAAAHGLKFVMIDMPGAIWDDRRDPGRISASSRPEGRARWVEEARPMLGERAYHGYRGWYLAKAHAQNGQKTKAFALYAGAVSRGCYSPPMAARILLQIALVNGGYRRIADFVIGKHLSKGADSQVR